MSARCALCPEIIGNYCILNITTVAGGCVRCLDVAGRSFFAREQKGSVVHPRLYLLHNVLTHYLIHSFASSEYLIHSFITSVFDSSIRYPISSSIYALHPFIYCCH